METLSRRRAYARAGALLGTGAPLGLLALRALASRYRRTARGLACELRSQALTYGYLATATSAVFALFGWKLGTSEDHRRAAQRETERLREEHAAVIAHDLRNPIHNILLQSETLLRDAPDEEVVVTATALQRIRRGAQRLGQMVAQLADATQLELARIRLDRKPIDLGGALADLLDRLRPGLGDHTISLEVRGELPRPSVDPVRFDEIVTNLVDNAAKYSAPGTPIRVILWPSDEGVVLSVKDQGLGIPPDEIPRLFDRYYQAKRARLQKSGLGLGLYITKGLVEAHRGRIWVESILGSGSTFHVWLPA